MSNNYVLSIPEDLASLEQDMNAWWNLPYDLRKIGNDNCIKKYGCTNEQLYNIMKAKLVQVDISEFDKGLSLETYLYKNKRILKGITEATFKVDPEDEVKGFTDDGQINDRLARIAKSIDIANTIDDEIVIINDFISDRCPDYTLEDLEYKYSQYQIANFDHRLKADNFSVELWGRTVPDMYTYMKNKIETMELAKNEEKYTPSLEQQRLDNYRNTVIRESSNDNIKKMIRALDCYKKSNLRSVYESVILEQFGDTIEIRGHSYRQDMPGVMPFLTYYEYLHNTKHLDQRKIHTRNPFCYVLNRINNKRNIEDLYNNHDNEAMLDNGWNPYIKPTAEAFQRAYERQIQFFDENYNFNIYDISNFYTNREIDYLSEDARINRSLTPIFITLLGTNNNPKSIVDRKYKYTDFTRLGICLNSDLKKVLTYELEEEYTDKVEKGRALEHITKDQEKINTVYRLKTIDISKIESEITTLHLLTFFVTTDIKKAIREGLDTYLENQDKSKFAFDSLLTLLNNKRTNRSMSLYVMVATFLDSIFRVANIYDKNSDKKSIAFNTRGKSYVNSEGSNRRKIYIMYNGDVRGYKKKKTDKDIAWLLKNVNKDTMNFFDDKSSYTDQPDYYDFDTYMRDYKATNESAGFLSLIESMRDILTPSSFIQEATLLQYSVQDLENKYMEIANLLQSYTENDLEGIKKQCKELIILYNICSIIFKNNQNDPEVQRIPAIKNSIYNRLMMYLKVIKNLEPEFDIIKYSEPNYEYEDINIGWKNSVYMYSSDNFQYDLRYADKHQE